MSFDHLYWNERFIEHVSSTGLPWNDVNRAKPVMPQFNLQPGDVGYKLMGIHYLTPEENLTGHYIYVDVLDEGGNRIMGAKFDAVIGEEELPDGTKIPIILSHTIDKPENEPGANVPMQASFNNYQLLNVQETLSDGVIGLNTWYYPGDMHHEDGNTLYHQSFYIVFQLCETDETVPPIDPPVEPPVGGEAMIIITTSVKDEDGIVIYFNEAEVVVKC